MIVLTTGSAGLSRLMASETPRPASRPISAPTAPTTPIKAWSARPHST